MSAPRSLQHEYELFVEREIELYKDSISRTALLSIGDEAVAQLREQAQTTLTEMVLWEEVDRIIARRIRLPSYRVWRQRRLKMLAEFRKPEHWGIAPTSALARELASTGDGGHVLVAGVEGDGAVIYPAAHGCVVTALDSEPDVVERVMRAAENAGLGDHVRGCVADLTQWSPDAALRVVVCAPTAFGHLTASECEAALTLLQGATLAGGVHLVRTATGIAVPSIDELRHRYADWSVTVEGEGAPGATFLARKSPRHH